MINDVKIIPLNRISDERGTIYHMIKNTDSFYDQVGEVYFSKSYPGVIKGWHLHKKMGIKYAVPIGMIKLVIYDLRQNSPTYSNIMELFLGEENYNLVIIPPGVANGYKTIGYKSSLVVNCATHPHEPEGEMQRIDPFNNDIPYEWGLKHK